MHQEFSGKRNSGYQIGLSISHRLPVLPPHVHLHCTISVLSYIPYMQSLFLLRSSRP